MTISRERVTCTCGHVFDAEMVINAPIEVAIASMKAVRCEKCGSGEISFGGALPGADVAGGSVVERAERWHRLGEVGVSSETIWAAFMSGTVKNGYPDIPHDPDDFRRCKLRLSGIQCRMMRFQAQENNLQHSDFTVDSPHWNPIS